MSTLALDNFLEWVERSKLIEHERLSQAVASWEQTATSEERKDAVLCADYLVDSELLTFWQSRKLLEGRHRGFFLGRYKLLDHLGSGGMSSVYLAEHVLMQRRVAIKVLPQNRVSDSSYLARFHQEGQAAAALDHRNIVRAYDLDNEGKIHYLVMEYIEGRDLHALVCQEGPLEFYPAANYIAQAAAGLDHAHHCGLIHRDIKPANLLVDRKGTVKILDMGLAKFTGQHPAAQRFPDEQVLGTADYLAPEQAVNSQTVDERADIYALGCTLYFLLTGHPPFAEGSSLDRMTAHQQQLPPSVLLDRPDAPAPLVTICRRMMEKSAQNRYQSAIEVYEALNTWLEGEVAAGHTNAAAVVAKIPHIMRQLSSNERPKSKLNLVSGSASDLHHVAQEPPAISSPFADTDSNLHRATINIDPTGSDARVLPHSPPEMEEPPSPPVVPPHSYTGPVTSVLPVPQRPVGLPPSSDVFAQPWPASDAQLPIAEPAPSEMLAVQATSVPFVIGARLRPRRRASTASWMWAIALSALILAALLLAVFALPG